MKKLLVTLLIPACAGCFTAHVPDVSEWNVVPDVATVRTAKTPAYGVARLSQVIVCAPYDERGMLVFRDDNTVASDPYNLFAAVPSRLLREPARSVLQASGKFSAVVGSASSANVSHVIELTVTDLRLDCSHDESHPDRREAVAEVFLLVLDKDRNIAGSMRGTARSDARDGNYGTAFSKAFSAALEDALRGI